MTRTGERKNPQMAATDRIPNMHPGFAREQINSICDKGVSISQRMLVLTLWFHLLHVSQVTTAESTDSKLDIKFRKLVRTFVGPPGGLDWSGPWPDILHDWKARVVECTEKADIKFWSLEKPGTTLANSKLHCQLSGELLVETWVPWHGRQDDGIRKYKRTADA